jgi:sterol desaturase/sphingolipid hydroxylase (fatty acid hydroxylase superfamily)
LFNFFLKKDVKMEFSKNSDFSENKDSKKQTSKMIPWLFVLFMLLCSLISIFTDMQFFTWMGYAFQVFLLWIAADFIAGVVHWWEDAYGNPNWPLIGKYIVEPNLIHHKQPNKLLEGSYWSRINTSLFAAAGLGGLLWWVGVHSWQVFVCLLFCVQGNEVHSMSHRPDKTTPRWAFFLQKMGIFQSKKAHRWHHRAPYETNFCIMTDFVNPMLNKIGFWRKLEWLILKLFRIDVLRASSIRKGL